MRRARARVRGDADNQRPVQLDGESRREIVRDEHGFGTSGQVDRVVIRQAEQDGQNTNVHVGEIAHPLAHHRVGVPREPLPPLEHFDVERLLRRQVLSHELLDPPPERAVFENRVLHVEDGRLFLSSGGLDALAHLLEAVLGPLNRVRESLQLRRDLLFRNEVMRHFGHLPQQEVYRADRHAWRCGNAPQRAVH